MAWVNHKFERISVSHYDDITLITLTSPKSKNAINFQAYSELVKALNAVANDPSAMAAVVTGEGDYFTSGADLREIRESHYNLAMVDPVSAPVGQFMKTVLDFPKLLVAAVNGPAVGIGVTLLTHCDLCYCSTSSTFWTPFASVGVVPEFCSSVTFPRIFGPSVAMEMLLGSRHLSCDEAKKFGLVSEIFSPETVLEETLKRVKTILSQPLTQKTIPLFKRMVKQPFRDELEEVFRSEMVELGRRTLNGETGRAIAATMEKKKEDARKRAASKL